MKAYKIAIFVTATIACLVLVWYFFPLGGVEVGGATLHSPTLPQASELVKSPAGSQLKSIFHFETRKQRIARLAAEAEARARAIEESGYLEAISNYDGIMALPDSGYVFFDRFFTALDSASRERVRVAYYGDSQLEEDRITNVLRDSLQARFGGSGVGLLPAVMENGTLTIVQSKNSNPPVSKINGGHGFKTHSYGPCYSVARISSPYHVKYSACKHENPDIPSRFFSNITVLADRASSFSVDIAGLSAAQDTFSLPMKRFGLRLDEPSNSVEIDIKGSGDVFGVMLDGANGVAVDNIALRGSSGAFFTDVDSSQLQDYLLNENVQLMVVQYGCNKVPSLNGKNSISSYGQSMYRQLKLFKELAPDMTIVFSGPQDMRHYQMMPDVVDTLKHYALKAGAAYWSMYDAMGGADSMAEWQQQGLAGGDGIHFSKKGAARMSDLFFEALMTYYRYYEWKNSLGI